MSFLDRFISEVDHGLKALLVSPSPARPNPADNKADLELNDTEIRQSQGFMRINHTGEICAQALYRGQALLAKDRATREYLLDAAKEENDHLVWCQHRLDELHTHASYLNPLWYAGSFLIGVTAAAFGDNVSLGFVSETEAQVERHLDGHLDKLSENDLKSRAILEQMREDEIEHGQHARDRGGENLPQLIKRIMRCQSVVMTRSAYYV